MKLNRQYQQGGEFKARQGRFDFAEVALTVLEIAVSVKTKLAAWWEKARPERKSPGKKPEQMILNFAGLPVFLNAL